MRERPKRTDFCIPETIKFLEMLGFKFTLDWDDELGIEEPGEIIEVGRIMWIVDQCRDRIRDVMRNRNHWLMRQFVGGPLNGRPHNLYRSGGVKIGPKKWAAYRVKRDGRAFFQGMTTSEAKAKLLARTVPQSGDVA